MKSPKIFSLFAIVAVIAIVSLSSCKDKNCYECAGQGEICEDDYDDDGSGLTFDESIDIINAFVPGTCVPK
ncbi:MAG: hypothetical protein ACI94Y_002282 [Maribacter sp.]|jgi:hypothetical protein